MPAPPALLPWPGETGQLFQHLAGKRDALCHPAYNLLRAVRWHEGWESKSRERDAPTVKDAAFRSAVSSVNNDGLRAVALHVRHRRMDWVQPLAARGGARVLRLINRTPLVVGLSSPGPLELGLSLHHVYGFPVLPASGLKGLARASAEIDPAGRAYGEIDFSSEVAILDGLPVSWTVSKDVMTPHQRRWYEQGGRSSWPDDSDDPMPIPFLSVDPGALFEVVLLTRHQTDDQALLDQVEEDLRRGMEERGFGAKTAAGYGWFEVERAELQAQQSGAEHGLGDNLVAGAPRDEFQERLGTLQALKANAGNITPFVDWCLKLEDPDRKKQLASLIVQKMDRKWVKDKAKSKESWKQILELASGSGN